MALEYLLFIVNFPFINTLYTLLLHSNTYFTNLHNLTETAGILSFALISNLRGSIGAELLDLS